jgi:leucyl aminopeptidase
MMPNGLNVRVALKNQMQDADAVGVLVRKWGEKQSPQHPVYGKELASLSAAGLISPKAGSIGSHLLADGKTRLIVVTVGELMEDHRVAGGALAKWVRKQKLKSICVFANENAPAVVTGFILGGFEYTDYKGTVSKDKPMSAAVTLQMVGQYSADQQAAIQRAIKVAEAQNYARSIASRPGNDINPPSLAKEAQRLAKEVGLGVTILDDAKMKQLGMGGILGVGAGSNATPPRMIVLEYSPKAKTAKGKAGESSLPTLLVVGKAITFDTGGISIKGAGGMQKMVFDKCGGMAVLGLMHALANLKLNCPVVGILASAENHISETAYRPGDILKMYNGVTVEVTNTDAEGRLVLGDALAWGIETYKPAAVVDLATLTGGVVIALGKTMAGIMSNDDGIVEEFQSASQLTGEKMWRLPIGDDQRDLLKSDPADIVNSGPREATPLQGGAFLSYFVPEKLPWIHIDIAGVADTEKELPYYSKGATGWGVRTLVEWVSARVGRE